MNASGSQAAARLLTDGRALRALARSLLGGSDGADDVVQDAYAAAAAHPDPGRMQRPWLLATVRNLAAMWRRSTMRRAARERTAARPELDAACDPSVIAQQSELMRDVAAAVHGLEEPFRTAVVLRFWRGLRPEAIAAQLGVPRNTVRSRLQRGLDRLRAELDRRHGGRERWAAPLAVRASVVGTSAAGWLAVAGVYMKTKLLVAASVLLMAVVAFEAWPAVSGSAAEPASTPAMVAASGEPRRQPEPVTGREVASSPATTVADQRSDVDPLVPVPQWMASMLVVDEEGKPVPEATVQIWAAMRIRVWRDQTGYRGHEERPRLELRSDAMGRATAVLDLEGYVAVASKDRSGRSREQWLWSAKAGKEVRLILEPEIRLHGRVLDSDGTPVAQAEVTVTVRPDTGFMDRGLPASPGRVVTDAAGTFDFAVQREVDYLLVGRLGSRESFPADVDVRDGHPPAVTLTFPGASGITGIVVDANDEPVVGAQVTAWREFARDDPQRNEPENVHATSDAHGRFAISVRRFARYQLLAAANGHATSELLWTETTAVASHPEVRLVLPAFATIRGRVVHEDGAPFAGLQVFATPEAGDRHAWIGLPGREDRFPRVKSFTTETDGSFTLQVHPGSTCTLELRLDPRNWRLRMLQPGIQPGRDDVVLTVSDATLRGCVIRGRVSRGDGLPGGSYVVDVVDCDANGEPMSSGSAEAVFDGAAFVCQPVARDQKFGLRVYLREDGPLAPAVVETFVTDRAELEFDVLLEAWGILPVRVLTADGSPARNVVVHLRRVVSTGTDHVVQEVDGEGRVSVIRCVPGRHKLFVSRSHQLLREQEVMVAPGTNPELEIRLPAR